MHTTHPLDGSLPLTHWGLIRARGIDAPSFLQAQLTNDVAGLTQEQARLAGFCSAKGRLQASFVVWKLADDDLLLACHASVLAATLKRLSMFVLRAKCTLTDAGSELALIGVVGDSARELLGDARVWARHAIDGGSIVRLPDAEGVPRGMAAVGIDADLAKPHAASPELTLADWQALEVRSGIPTIEVATVDRFVPQMLNFELIGGIDFQKGCYPGQEVVARSQYRGSIKRRMFLFECDASVAAGQEVFHSADAAQPAGLIVNAAVLGEGPGSIALAEVKLAALDSGTLHAGSVDGALLERRELPYAVPFEAAAGA